MGSGEVRVAFGVKFIRGRHKKVLSYPFGALYAIIFARNTLGGVAFRAGKTA